MFDPKLSLTVIPASLSLEKQTETEKETDTETEKERGREGGRKSGWAGLAVINARGLKTGFSVSTPTRHTNPVRCRGCLVRHGSTGPSTDRRHLAGKLVTAGTWQESL